MKFTEQHGALAWLLIALMLTLWPAAVFAHVGSGASGGFLTGVQHPVSGLDHVLAMIAVGLWGAQLGAPALWLLPVAFPMMMAFGGMFGLMGIPLPGVEVGIAIGLVHRWKAGRMALRGAGALVCAAGLFFLWGALS